MEMQRSLSRKMKTKAVMRLLLRWVRRMTISWTTCGDEEDDDNDDDDDTDDEDPPEVRGLNMQPLPYHNIPTGFLSEEYDILQTKKPAFCQ
jgi:hypothetical protein